MGEKILLWVIVLCLLIAAGLPASFMLQIINGFLPQNYKLHYNLLGLMSAFLTIATGYLFNIELEGGILNVVCLVFIGSFTFSNIIWL